MFSFFYIHAVILLAKITASIQHDMEAISLLYSTAIEDQVALITAFSSSVLLDRGFLIFLLTIRHKFSMGNLPPVSGTMIPNEMQNLLWATEQWSSSLSP